MKQLKQFISEKLHISQYKKQQEINDDNYFIFVIVYGDLYDEFVSDYSDAMIRASSYPDGFIVNVDEVESYINLSELYAYEKRHEFLAPEHLLLSIVNHPFFKPVLMLDLLFDKHLEFFDMDLLFIFCLFIFEFTFTYSII